MSFTNPFKITVDDTVGVEVAKTVRNIRYLRRLRPPSNVVRWKPTRLSRSAEGFLSMYSNNSPPGIQTETNWSGAVVTPRSGTTFGCSKRFHTAASWKKAYVSG